MATISAGEINIGPKFMGLTYNPTCYICDKCRRKHAKDPGVCRCGDECCSKRDEQIKVNGLQLSITAIEPIDCIEGEVKIKGETYPLLINSRKIEDNGRLIECNHDLAVPVGKTVWVNVLFSSVGIPAEEFLADFAPFTLKISINGVKDKIKFDDFSTVISDYLDERRNHTIENTIYA